MEILSKLFGSEAKVKIMRLFLFSPDTVFDTVHISERAQVDQSRVRKELLQLEKINLIKRRVISRGGGKKKASAHGFMLNTQFQYLVSLQNFLINTEPLQSKEIVHKITKLGSIKLLLVAGVFTQEPESRVDILVVGDHVKPGSFENTIRSLESEVGKELRYAYFTTEDFQYRVSMFDKLIRDILDYPHKKLINKLGNV